MFREQSLQRAALPLQLFGLLLAQLALKLLKPHLDPHLLVAAAHKLFPMTFEEVVDGFNAQLDGVGRAVLIDILEGEVRRSRALHDLFDGVIDRRVVAAFEAGNLDRDQVGMPGGKLGGPEFVVGTSGERGLPHIGDIERVADDAGPHSAPNKRSSKSSSSGSVLCEKTG